MTIAEDTEEQLKVEPMPPVDPEGIVEIRIGFLHWETVFLVPLIAVLIFLVMFL